MDKIITAPRKARDLQGSGRLPELENLQGKTADELVRTLNRFGIEPDYAGMSKRANKAYERLGQAIEEGIEPDEHTWELIDKQIESQMEQNLRKMTKAAIRNYKMKALKENEKGLWVAVQGGQNSCPSCEKRHGKIKTMKQWKQLGLPGSGALICDGECRCNVVPVASGVN